MHTRVMVGLVVLAVLGGGNVCLRVLSERMGRSPGWLASVLAKKVTGRCSAADDLDRLCMWFDQAEALPADDQAPEERLGYPGELLCHNDVLEVLQAIALVGPSDKARFMYSGAAEAGAPAWRCPSMDRHWARDDAERAPRVCVSRPCHEARIPR